MLIYATFAYGQQRFGRLRDPRHLLMPGVLLEAARGRLRVVAYERPRGRASPSPPPEGVQETLGAARRVS